VGLDAAVGNAGIVYRLQRVCQGAGQREKIVEIEFALLFRPTVQRLPGKPGLYDKLLLAIGLQGNRRTNPGVVQHFQAFNFLAQVAGLVVPARQLLQQLDDQRMVGDVFVIALVYQGLQAFTQLFGNDVVAQLR